MDINAKDLKYVAQVVRGVIPAWHGLTEDIVNEVAMACLDYPRPVTSRKKFLRTLARRKALKYLGSKKHGPLGHVQGSSQTLSLDFMLDQGFQFSEDGTNFPPRGYAGLIGRRQFLRETEDELTGS